MLDIGIVGSGVPSLYAANMLSSKGHNVTILEAESNPGGLYKNIITKFGNFDLGCRFISLTENNDIDNFINSICSKSKNWKPLKGKKSDISGCYFEDEFQLDSSIIDTNNLNKHERDKLLNNITREYPITDEIYPKQNLSLLNYWNNRFGDFAANKIINNIFIQKFGISAKFISSSCLNIFPVRRLIFTKNVDEILKKNKNWLYIKASKPHNALPDKLFLNKCAYYPRKVGIGQFVDDSIKILEKKNVKFVFNHNINKINIKGEKVITYSESSNSPKFYDYLIWNAPEKNLKNSLSIKNKDKKFCSKNFFLLNCILDNATIPKNIYYAYDYSKNTIKNDVNIYRVNYYDNYSYNGFSKKMVKVSVELTSSIYEKPNAKDIIRYLCEKKFILNYSKINYLNIIGPFRLPIFMVKDKKINYPKKIINSFNFNYGENTLHHSLIKMDKIISEI